MIDFQLIKESLPSLFQGLFVTIKISTIGCLIGFSLGTFLAIIQTSAIPVLNFFVNVYVTFIRGTPMLIQILFIYYLLPQLGIMLPTTWAAIIAIGLNSAAYISQVIKSGIGSVNKGQREAAQVLGFSTLQTVRYIILPQAMRVVLPALGNELITLIKDSSLASIIGVAELTKEGRIIISRTYDAISIFFIVALFYLVLTSLISLLVMKLEQRMQQHAKN
jgi:His/Glu/Gln/Arg/opine family amino acid ABC transporter permease subunit